LQTVELLLKHGANTNIESKFDKTPLEIASENGRPDIFEILQNAEQFRVMAIDCGEGGEEESSLVVSQQEVVSTDQQVARPHTVKFIKQSRPLPVQPPFSPVKSELAGLAQDQLSNSMQISLDPIQIALNSMGESPVGSPLSPGQDEAMKLLASHGIRMLPEEPAAPPAAPLSLTEAGKLALSLAAPAQPKLTKIVTLNSSPVRTEPARPAAASPLQLSNSSNKPIRVIKLTPAQAEAFKKGRAGQQLALSRCGLGGRVQPLTGEEDSPARKVIKLEENAGASRAELQRQLRLKAEEAEKLKEETKKRELECERLKAQLEALGGDGD